ncbi:MFS transporter [Microvirga sp. GCM10011540]|uniref:MFS transporter n=1 Tax=Microvirga sp. GCM10011540 TaxID=3317338 RepID=UPI00361DE03F
MSIQRRTVLCIGFGQLICWGISYYLIGAFGEMIVADLGWSRTLVYGGFSVALVVMGLSSPLVGRLIDAHGGRSVMAVGSALTALGCIGLAVSHEMVGYYASWVCLGLAMRLTLYEAAFAALARLGGPEARRPMSQITLFGGLSSSVFWPIGFFLAGQFTWRGALLAYAAFALLTVPLYLAIPKDRHSAATDGKPLPDQSLKHPPTRDRTVTAGLFCLVVVMTNVLSSAMSAHMIGALEGMGVTAATAVGIGTLRGIGQFGARLCEVLFGARLHPLDLYLIAVALLPASFGIGLLTPEMLAAAFVFALLFGAGNGLVTIGQGTVPLFLFDPATYGAYVGKLLVPGFLFSAASPLLFAFVIEQYGERTAIGVCCGMALVALLAVALLRRAASA